MTRLGRGRYGFTVDGVPWATQYHGKRLGWFVFPVGLETSGRGGWWLPTIGDVREFVRNSSP